MDLTRERRTQLIRQFREIADRAERLRVLTGLEMYRDMSDRARARLAELEADEREVKRLSQGGAACR